MVVVNNILFMPSTSLKYKKYLTKGRTQYILRAYDLKYKKSRDSRKNE